MSAPHSPIQTHGRARPVRAAFCGLGIFLLLSASLTRVFAQGHPGDRVKEIQRALQRADYNFAGDLADSAIANFEHFTPAQLAEIHALRALTALEQKQSAIADAHFLSALQLVPDFRLDPIFFSPTLQERFEQLRAKLPKAENPVRVETRYVTLPDPRIKSAGKSLLVPGWGQRAKGHRTRGWLFTSAAAALTTATLTAHLLRASAEDNYLKADAQNVAQRYDVFNRYHLLRNNFALGLGLIWSTNVLEALLSPANPAPVSFGITPPRPATSNEFMLALTLKF